MTADDIDGNTKLVGSYIKLLHPSSLSDFTKGTIVQAIRLDSDDNMLLMDMYGNKGYARFGAVWELVKDYR
jgi:hypothetical protein